MWHFQSILCPYNYIHYSIHVQSEIVVHTEILSMTEYIYSAATESLSPPSVQNCPKVLSEATRSPLLNWVTLVVRLEDTSTLGRLDGSLNCGIGSFRGILGYERRLNSPGLDLGKIYPLLITRMLKSSLAS